ncbi:Cation efflux system protein CzcC [Anaerohalosphaera lusitana]|uniref:Cation efflux system protein CzcC n=1 Tax=Anaerohalosphaera lusitana TaxID=1936003 RepID=A0A1U9NNK1_9BACT|nr:TolC family protein [Anaerohalosphaera lusitana]AQT69483.1 Cation efflux system protein CzcC [Anaerohalosphaera lusitana]
MKSSLNRTVWVFIVVVLVLSKVGVSGQKQGESEQKTVKVSTLRDYLRYAALHNAELKGAFQEFRAAVEQVPQSEALPDPQFKYTYFIEEVETRVGPQKQRVGISQTFPWFGVIEARTDAAAMAAKAAKERYEAVKLELFNKVKQAFYEYAYLFNAIEIAEQNLELLEHFEEVARIRYKAAAAEHPDIIRAQVEYAKLADELESLRELRRPILAKLNALLNRPEDAALPWPERAEYEPEAVQEEKMLAFLQEKNPELTAQRFGVEVARQRVVLARKRSYPDVTAGIEWIDVGSAVNSGVSDSGQDALMATVSFNLPIWGKNNRARERQATANMLKAKSQVVELQNDLIARASKTVYLVQDGNRKVELYEDILVPKATEMVSASETAYMSGKVDFLSLVDAQRQLLEFQLKLERAITDSLQSLAELEALTGGRIK